MKIGIRVNLVKVRIRQILVTKWQIDSVFQHQIMFLYFQLDNNHNGTMEFRICRVTNPRVDPTPACFNANPLEFEDGNTVRDINNAQLRGWFDHSPTGVSTTGNGTHQVHVYRVKLPDNFVCNHCLFQMRWHVVDAHQYIGS